MRKGKCMLLIMVLLCSASLSLTQCATPTEPTNRLNVGYLACVETLELDETIGWYPMAWTWWRLVYDRTFRYGLPPNYAPEAQLVTEWETEDRQTWIAHLNPDAVWHDGVPVTAEDLKFTLTDFFEAEPRWKYPSSDCESVTVINDHTLKFTLKAVHGDPVYPPMADLLIVPKHIWEPYFQACRDEGKPLSEHGYDNADAIGSGPFKLKEFKPGEYLWLEAHDDYYERPYVDEVVLRAYGTADSLYAALQSGEIDVIGYGGISPLALEDFQGVEGIEILSSPGDMMSCISFNLHQDSPLGNNKAVRQAFMHAIDKDAIIDIVFRGYAEAINSHVYPEMPVYNPELPWYGYNVSQANAILDSAGYNWSGDWRYCPEYGKLSFELMINSDDPIQTPIAQMIKEQLEDVGIEIVVKSVDRSTFGAYLYDPEADQFDLAITGMDPGPDNSWVWEWFRTGGLWNSTFYSNSYLDGLIDAMYAETDMEAYIDLWYEMQDIVAEDLPYGMLWRPDVIDPVSDEWEGWQISMGGVVGWTNQWSYLKVHLKE
ncbi:MAG: ABC transporter substrate-binding protein [Dehalococcoidia bacterium]|nr:ABC transporter substrate-binding protein [Dehalococcoidia bacterium]